MMESELPSLAHALRLHALGEDFVLLFSSLRTSYSGERSLLAHSPAESVSTERFLDFVPRAGDGLWFGWLGYGLRHGMESLPVDAPSVIPLPALHMTRFAQMEEYPSQPMPTRKFGGDAAGVTALASNMTKEAYLEKVAATIETIREGKFYQANITRKFYGELKEGFSVPDIFCRLCGASPAPYSAWIRVGDAHILSSSPELFLRIAPGRKMTTRPIKGSAPLAQSPDSLRASEKDRAENLMIADLMRNDFSRVAESGSVRVSELFGIDSFTTIHHMSSTVEARLAEGKTVMDAIMGCFPPGSMTGAPKIAAMKWCSAMEGIERGIYSGALGWIGPDACELSVVIRTLVIQGNRFEFQVGGGIVADSTPEAEWRETLTKARGIASALGIDEAELAAL